MVNSWKPSTKIWNKTRMPTLTSSIQHSIGSPSHSNQTRKRNKRYPNWKWTCKIVITCRWHDTIYIENPKDSTQKLVEQINEFSKETGYKINIQISVAFLYTNNEISERECAKIVPLKITSQRIKYLGINLMKEVKDLNSENYKKLIKEIEHNSKKWKDSPCS